MTERARHAHEYVQFAKRLTQLRLGSASNHAFKQGHGFIELAFRGVKLGHMFVDMPMTRVRGVARR